MPICVLHRNPSRNPHQVLHLQGNELVRVDGLGSLMQVGLGLGVRGRVRVRVYS